jgi:hypothetical protein
VHFTPEQLAALNVSYLACLAASDWPQALTIAQQALQAMPGHPQILGDVALCQMRLGNHAASEQAYKQALQLAPNEANLYDGMAELYGLTHQADKAKHYGMQALALKDALCAQPVLWPLPKGVAPPLSDDHTRNVIAFSLFGSNPRYCETAVLNVQAAAALFPNWICRFYVDDTVPEDVCARLWNAGAQLMFATGDEWQGIPPLMWRFAVMDDPTVQRYLLRDADSLLSTREQAAVQAWLESRHWFHMMRDYYSHTELLLAGLLGGCAGVFDELRSNMRTYALEHTHEQRVVDQHFLRKCVWPTVRQSLLTHDSWFGFLNAQPFPEHSAHGLGEQFHVGCNLSSASVGSEGLSYADGTPVHWCLLDAQGQVVCAYSTQVQQGGWRAALPMPYIERIKVGEWKIETIFKP